MFIKDPYNILVEAAELDLKANTMGVVTESQITTTMNSFEEVCEDIVITAEMVSVIRTADGTLLTEMNNLYPYMKSNGIKSVAEALNNVAKVNGLEEKSVGLLIESDDYINAMLEKADEKAKKGKLDAKNKVLDKVKKATELPAKLKKEGFPIKKKKSAKKECGDCPDGNC